MSDRPGVVREATPGETIEWHYDVPLLTSRFMVWDFVRVTLVSVGIMYALVALTGWLAEGEIVLLPLPVLALTAGILLVLFVLASLLLGNHHGARFTVAPHAVTYAAEERERRVNRAVAVIGALAGNPTATGAGLLAMSSEHLRVPWADVERVVYYPGPRVIVLRNSWRAVLRLHCTAQDYPRVAALCDAYWRAAAPVRDAARPQGFRRGPWWYHASLFAAALAAGLGAQVWYWNDYTTAARFGAVGAGLVALSMLFEGLARRGFAVLSFPLLVWHGGAVAVSAFGTVEGLFGRSYVAGLDPGELTITGLSFAVLLGMAAWRAFGPTR